LRLHERKEELIENRAKNFSLEGTVHQRPIRVADQYEKVARAGEHEVATRLKVGKRPVGLTPILKPEVRMKSTQFR